MQRSLTSALQQLKAAVSAGAPPGLELLEQVLAELEREQEETQRKLQRIAEVQRNLDDRLVKIEHGAFFRALRAVPSALHSFRARLLGGRPGGDRRGGDGSYEVWLASEVLATPPLERLRETASAFRRQPTISILMPIAAPRQEWLEAAVESVLAQSYDRWQLCACVVSGEKEAAEYLLGKARSDPRISVDASAVSNREEALVRGRGLARGEYIGILGQHDLLSPHALHHIVEALQDSTPELVYTDEDGIDARGERRKPVFKPDWSPELLAGCMYLGRFLTVSRQALDRMDWFRGGFGPMQDYDAALRLAETGAGGRRVPRVLYHRRVEEEPGAHEAGRRALAEAAARRGWQADVEDGPAPLTYRLRRGRAGQPLVSLIVCSRQARLLRRFLRAAGRRTSYGLRETVVVEHMDGASAWKDGALKTEGCVRVPYEGPFNFAWMNNLGARTARGEILLFMNDDVEPLTPDWLERMVAQACREEVGAVGAKLLYPSGLVQHAGIAIGIMDGVGHPGRGQTQTPYWNWLDMTRNVSAVTGACMAVRRQVFEELGGFDPMFPVNYNDVDFCLRARQAGYEVVYEAAAVLRHHEARSRLAVVRYSERERFYERWGRILMAGDPYYSPNLTREREDASLRLED
jgi:hypothetical protein